MHFEVALPGIQLGQLEERELVADHRWPIGRLLRCERAEIERLGIGFPSLRVTRPGKVVIGHDEQETGLLLGAAQQRDGLTKRELRTKIVRQPTLWVERRQPFADQLSGDLEIRHTLLTDRDVALV